MRIDVVDLGTHTATSSRVDCDQIKTDSDQKGGGVCVLSSKKLLHTQENIKYIQET